MAPKVREAGFTLIARCADRGFPLVQEGVVDGQPVQFDGAI